MQKRACVCIAGWVVAAAAAAWWASSSEEVVPDGGGTASPPSSPTAVSKPSPSAVGKADKSAALRNGGRGRKAADKAAKEWLHYDKWNVPALYAILGNVPPDVRAVADRIREAHAKAMRKNDLKPIFDCVADARACPNPIVRAMMVDALRLCAMRASNSHRYDFDELTEKQKSIPNSCCLAAIEAAKGFASDPNKFVARNAVNAISHGVVGIRDLDKRFSAFEDAVSVTDGMICRELASGEFSGRWYMSGVECNELEAKNACLLALSRSIENLGEGEGRRLATELYKKYAGEAYSGLENAENLASWKMDLKDVGTTLFGTVDKGQEFAEIMDRATLSDRNMFEGKDEDVLAASQRYGSPEMALTQVELTIRLKQAAKDLYGDTEKAQKWYLEEMAFYEDKLKEWDDQMKPNEEAKEEEDE